MKTITIDILNQRVLKLLQELELLQLIRLRKEKPAQVSEKNVWLKLKGSMTKEPLDIVDKQLDDIRGAWE
jgi:hypothetical protein